MKNVSFENRYGNFSGLIFNRVGQLEIT